MYSRHLSIIENNKQLLRHILAKTLGLISHSILYRSYPNTSR